MRSCSTPFDSLPFSKLFQEYTRNPDSLQSFFDGNPWNENDLETRAGEFRFVGDRQASVHALRAFNRSLGMSGKGLKQIDRLKDPNALAVVTGQQLTLYGGPLFTVYKTLTAILYARRWEQKLNRPVIPVFWLADEDHDFDEAIELGLLHQDRWVPLKMESESGGGPVGRDRLGPEFKSFEAEFFDLLPVSDFTPHVRELLQKTYHDQANFREAFAGLLLHLFEREGLVLAGSDDPAIKALTAGPMQTSAAHPDDVVRSLEKQSTALEKQGYGRQALVQTSNIFYLDPENGRQKLRLAENAWSNGNGRCWNTDELLGEIEAHPERFSPNVFLRPLMQDRLLPTLAYVCGPGELAYYAQMKDLYRLAGQRMPMLLPRFSATLIEPAIDRVVGELPFELTEYVQRPEDLESQFVRQNCQYEIETLFESWREEIRSGSEDRMKWIENVDPTLKASADKVITHALNEVTDLEERTWRAVKKQQSISIERIHRIREHLFPSGKPQERQLSMIYYMNRYGTDLWRRLLLWMEDEENHPTLESDRHHWIYL
ncbi:MAG: bacillithiol biosynthesis cysteine-adding enzyme BshC [Balneolaceae bacterium]